MIRSGEGDRGGGLWCCWGKECGWWFGGEAGWLTCVVVGGGGGVPFTRQLLILSIKLSPPRNYAVMVDMNTCLLF